jgi:hypothetical protein
MKTRVKIKDNPTAFVPTSDDWYPNFKGNLVRVRLHLSCGEQAKPFLRVSVWGNDDTGMELDFDAKDSASATQVFLDVLSQRSLTKAWLKQKGFGPA